MLLGWCWYSLILCLMGFFICPETFLSSCSFWWRNLAHLYFWIAIPIGHSGQGTAMGLSFSVLSSLGFLHQKAKDTWVAPPCQTCCRSTVWPLTHLLRAWNLFLGKREDFSIRRDKSDMPKSPVTVYKLTHWFWKVTWVPQDTTLCYRI